MFAMARATCLFPQSIFVVTVVVIVVVVEVDGADLRINVSEKSIRQLTVDWGRRGGRRCCRHGYKAMKPTLPDATAQHRSALALVYTESLLDRMPLVQATGRIAPHIMAVYATPKPTYLFIRTLYCNAYYDPSLDCSRQLGFMLTNSAVNDD